MCLLCGGALTGIEQGLVTQAPAMAEVAAANAKPALLSAMSTISSYCVLAASFVEFQAKQALVSVAALSRMKSAPSCKQSYSDLHLRALRCAIRH